MDTDKTIRSILETNVLVRERFVKNLEELLEEKIEHIDTSLKNTHFLQDAKSAIITSLQYFKPGEEVTMNSFANSYSCTKEGSKGRIVSQGEKGIRVDFYYQTGRSNPNQSETFNVDKNKAYKTKFYNLFTEFKDYTSVAERILYQAVEEINLIDMCSDSIEKLLEKDNVYLINDKALLEEIKQDSVYSKRICLDGVRKYLRGIGTVRVEINMKFVAKNLYSLRGKNIEKALHEKNEYPDYDSAKLAQVKVSQELAELSIMEEAKKVNANYVLINQKHIFESENRILTTVVEGLPFMIIGKPEVENLLNKPHLEEGVVTAIKNFIPSEIIKSNYTSFAKFYPKEFITYFSSIESAERKKLIIESLMEIDYDNKEVIAWLDEHESGLVREVGLKIV